MNVYTSVIVIYLSLFIVQHMQHHFLQDSLQDALKNGNYYEALQLYLSISQRYVKQKRQEDAMKILQSGINELIQHGQMQGAIELSEKLLGIFENPWCQSYRKHVLEVLKVMTLPLPVAKSFLDSAIEISVKLNNDQHDPLLHAEIAKLYVQSGDIEGSIDHFVRAPSSYLCNLSESIANTSTFSNHDLEFTTLLAVIRFVKMKRLQEAAQVLDHVLISCSDIVDETIYETQSTSSDNVLQIQWSEKCPLLNLAQLLILVLQRSNKDTLKEILQHYQSSISKYPKLSKELNSLIPSNSETRSSINSTGSNMGDLFNQVLRGLFQPSSTHSRVPHPEID